ncbi:MAG TPA: hypothetical protein PKH07_19170, partial [bacterium]|nr:hypothetical protein [bacterium]
SFREAICKGKDYIEGSVLAEVFWYHTRYVVRSALFQAIKGLNLQRNAQGCLPVRILMLGGDDLLLVLKGSDAFRFIVAFAQKAKEMSNKSKEAWKPLNSGIAEKLPEYAFGAGIALCPLNYPFHLAHQLAEQLLKSAKRMSREFSTVDWEVVVGSMVGDLDDYRHNVYCRKMNKEQLKLIKRPLAVLPSNGHFDLKTLNDDVGELDKVCGEGEGKVARSKLRTFMDELGKGRRHAEWTARDFFGEHMGKPIIKKHFHAVWTESASKKYETQCFDLIQMMEFIAKAEEAKDVQHA